MEEKNTSVEEPSTSTAVPNEPVLMSTYNYWKNKQNIFRTKAFKIVKKLSQDTSNLNKKSIEIKESNDKILETIADVTKTNNEIKTKLKLLEKQRKRRERKMDSIAKRMQDFEILTHISEPEFVNIPEEIAENKNDLIKAVIHVFKKVNTEIALSEMEEVYGPDNEGE